MKKLLFTLLTIVTVSLGAFAEKTDPSFPGGEKALDEFISTNLKYPEIAKENGVEGVVNVGFNVKIDGSIGAIKIIRLVDPDLEQESIRIVKLMPKWIPATVDGKPVEAPAEVAVPFILE